MDYNLNLPEALVLLGLEKKNAKFRFTYRFYMQTFSIAAVFIELLLQRRLIIDDHEKVIFYPSGPAKLDYIEKVCLALTEKPKPRSLKSWLIYFFYRFRLSHQIHQHILERLEQKNAVTVVKKKYFIFFPRKLYAANQQLQDRIVERLRAELLEEGPVDRQTVALCALLLEAKFLNDYFSYYEKSQLQEKMNDLKENHESFRWINSVDKAIKALDIHLFLLLGGAGT